MTYRTPRVLHWLAEGHWHWIHTAEYRMNNRACGFEWLSAPLILFAKSDRALFLLNFIPFLLLPGLIFSVFTRLGIRPKVAWHWMWLFPTGYTFIVQAGSGGNDTFPTVYALAAVDFACRAWSWLRREGSFKFPTLRPFAPFIVFNGDDKTAFTELCFSILAASLLAGAKASNIPLLLVWAILVFPLLPLFVRRLAVVVPVAALAAVVSFLPTAAFNIIHAHDWSGLSLEAAAMNMKHPFVGIWGNLFLLVLDNFVPTFFPFAMSWNESFFSFVPEAITDPLRNNFDIGFEALYEMPSEDWAGLGFGLCILLVFSFRAARRIRLIDRTSNSNKDRGGTSLLCSDIPAELRRWAIAAGWIALLAYCLKSGMATGARLISPYYAFLVPVFLTAPELSQVIRQRWWRGMAWAVFVLAILVVIFLPGHPLWPAETLLTKAKNHLTPAPAPTPRPAPPKPASTDDAERIFDTWSSAQPREAETVAAAANVSLFDFAQPAVERALNVYTVYGQRFDPLAQIRAIFPPRLDVIGFLGNPDDVAISLWRPFGSRRVENILITDSAADIRQRSIEYAVTSEGCLGENAITLPAWLHRMNADLIATVKARGRVNEGLRDWYLVRFRPEQPKSSVVLDRSFRTTTQWGEFN